jgi:two-component system KDP operon response regulator KdpE
VSHPILRVLVVDDEAAVRRALSVLLLERGFLVAEASRGEEALRILRAELFDGVLLDINMPGIGGFETLRRIRSFAPRLPILMFSDHDKEADKVEAFSLDADDYITKPFRIRELIARIRRRIRSVKEPVESETAIMEIGDICLEPSSRTVTKCGDPVHLTPKEFEILRFLMKNANHVVTHERLLTQVWGSEYGSEVEYLRTFIRQLRKKLEDDHSNPRYLITASQVGYRFADALEVASRRRVRP